MRKLMIGAVLGAVALGAAAFGGTAQAQQPPLGTGGLTTGGLSTFPLCNLLEGAPCPFFNTPSPEPAEVGNGAAPGDPNPILVFIIPPAPGSVIIPVAGRSDMNQRLCLMPPGPSNSSGGC